MSPQTILIYAERRVWNEKLELPAPVRVTVVHKKGEPDEN